MHLFSTVKMTIGVLSGNLSFSQIEISHFGTSKPNKFWNNKSTLQSSNRCWFHTWNWHLLGNVCAIFNSDSRKHTFILKFVRLMDQFGGLFKCCKMYFHVTTYAIQPKLETHRFACWEKKKICFCCCCGCCFFILLFSFIWSNIWTRTIVIVFHSHYIVYMCVCVRVVKNVWQNVDYTKRFRIFRSEALQQHHYSVYTTENRCMCVCVCVLYALKVSFVYDTINMILR